MWRIIKSEIDEMRRAGWRAWIGDAAGALSLIALIWVGFMVLEVLR